VPAQGRATLTVAANPNGATASPSQAGLLLMYRDAARPEAQGVRVEGTTTAELISGLGTAQRGGP